MSIGNKELTHLIEYTFILNSIHSEYSKPGIHKVVGRGFVTRGSSHINYRNISSTIQINSCKYYNYDISVKY